MYKYSCVKERGFIFVFNFVNYEDTSLSAMSGIKNLINIKL